MSPEDLRVVFTFAEAMDRIWTLPDEFFNEHVPGYLPASKISSVFKLSRGISVFGADSDGIERNLVAEILERRDGALGRIIS